MIRVSIIAVWLSLALSWMLAAQQQSSGVKTKNSPPVVTVTAADNGKDVDLPTGDILVVRLGSNPSTGYGWAIKGEYAPLRLMKSSTKKKPQNTHSVGSPVTQEFRLTATSAGMATLTLEYRRPWEYGVPPAKTFSVKVNAR